jgi:hypothetical protein
MQAVCAARKWPRGPQCRGHVLAARELEIDDGAATFPLGVRHAQRLAQQVGFRVAGHRGQLERGAALLKREPRQREIVRGPLVLLDK